MLSENRTCCCSLGVRLPYPTGGYWALGPGTRLQMLCDLQHDALDTPELRCVPLPSPLMTCTSTSGFLEHSSGFATSPCVLVLAIIARLDILMPFKTLTHFSLSTCLLRGWCIGVGLWVMEDQVLHGSSSAGEILRHLF
jgi:hypothetical protein